MKKTLNRLDSVHQKLIAKVSPLDPNLFSTPPSDTEWSVSQILHHLFLVEERVIKDLEAAVSNPTQKVGFLGRLKPTSIVSMRLVRVKAPKAVNPLQTPPKDEAIENLNRARTRLKDFCARTGPDKMRNLVFNHPFLGRLDGVAAVSFVGHHEHRHYKQILEVLKKLSAPT
jgi:DinB superfamily